LVARPPNISLQLTALRSLRSLRAAADARAVGTQKFEIHDSVALILEYKDILQPKRAELGLSHDDALNPMLGLSQIEE
jgi:hypothetical protein